MNRIMSIRTRNALPIALLLGLAGTSTAAAAADPAAAGLEIARKADAANQGFVGEKATMTLELINAHGEVTKRKMAMEVLEGTDDGDKSRSVFEWHADVKGTKLLTWTHKKGDDDRWLYLPAVKRIKRISSSNKSGSFMGSEFAYEDFSSQELEKYTYKLLDEPKQAGRDTWRIERFPVEKDSGYARQIMWMDKEYLNPLRIEYFDRKNELLKVAVFEGYKKFGKFWRFGTIRMENVQTKKKSVLTWENRELGQKPAAENFDSGRLED
jgi:Outer membrane lipoprotein-sorting protein